ncbi:MAG: SOS response-associated peptidase, partial [Bacteroidota bacterium]
PANRIRERFSVDVPDFYAVHYNAAPTQLLPVITSGSQGLSLFYWGTSPEWSKNKMLSEKIYNLRSEHLEEKPALKRAMMKTRCIVPADGFYAWKKVGKKTSIPYRFVLANSDLFSFAGIWEEFEDTEGHQIQTFNIFTTPSTEPVSLIQERMPVMLTPETEKVWLEKSSAEADLVAILKPFISSKINYYPVSPKISNHAIDMPSLIIPTPPADQFGNLTLFD